MSPHRISSASQVGAVLERHFGVFDAEHSMIESVISDIRLILSEFLLSDEFDPVTIWIQTKGNVLHPSLCEFLLECDSQSVKTGTRIFQRTHGNTNLSSASQINIIHDQIPYHQYPPQLDYLGSEFPVCAFQSLSGFSVPQLWVNSNTPSLSNAFLPLSRAFSAAS
jgi:hypothetical protein